MPTVCAEKHKGKKTDGGSGGGKKNKNRSRGTLFTQKNENANHRKAYYILVINHNIQIAE